MALGPDPHSFANFHEIVVQHMDLAFDIDFNRHVFTGTATLKLRRLVPSCNILKLDVKGLRILGIRQEGTNDALWLRLVSSVSELGDCLEVTLPPGSADSPVVIIVAFETAPGAAAIQWLEPVQTAGGKHPLVFTQCQAICSRTLFPCQDTPSVKSSFTLTVTCPQPLVALGSGIRQDCSDEASNGTNTFKFSQNVPVMAYLVAVICGSLEERSVGSRSSIWVESPVADAAQEEFQGVPDAFIGAAEKIVGSSYDWGRYDIALLPRSFIFGGMENPNMTFFSSALMTGDGSLLTTLAHEITHAWSGNLVTNAKWKDFWLNEGFTRYIERRILGRLRGKAFRGLLLTVGYNDLVRTVQLLTSCGENQFTALEPELVGIDPGRAFSRIPYEKGSLFLFYLEGIVGGEEAMTEWLKTYFSDFARQSIETADFKKHFCNFFDERNPAALKGVDWDAWLHGRGLPSFDLKSYADQSLVKDTRDLADRWLSGGTSLMVKPEPEGVSSNDLVSWQSQQIMVFLDNLINAGPCKMPKERLGCMDELYCFTQTRNVEVSFRWLHLCMMNRREECLPAVEAFVSNNGRGVYLKTLYAELLKLDAESAHLFFKKHQAFYQDGARTNIRCLLDAS
eukprot:TRINITY_DN43785_c0_g1_i1.p1 TRINITY_DN43785_c0_g1~~TRINITY_DN43785_c0_g1_i1.p1  ORF type:complete len:623 (-),score=111.48 TRINITY_DN43785_c0_g1_i1:103-1971(-)